MERKQSAWIRGGRVEEVAWVDRDVLAWCSGTHVISFDVNKRQRNVYTCIEADGMCCLSGNPEMRLLCLAEKCVNPKIFVYTYPTMKLISSCADGSTNGYLATAFASSDFVITLGSLPSYSIIVWSWKSGERLASIAGPLHDLQGQCIKVAKARPTLVAQLGKDSGRLFIWEMACTSTIVMTSRQVLLPDSATPVDVDWSTSGDIKLALADKHGHVYVCNRDGSEVNRIVLSQRCGVCLLYETPAVCWFQGGIVLKTTFCQIRFYRTNGQDHVWRREQLVKSSLQPYLLTRHPFQVSKMLYFTIQGFLMEMNLSVDGQTPLNIEEKFFYGGIYNFMDIVYPWGHDLVALDSTHVYIIDVSSGEVMGKLDMKLDGHVTALVSHLNSPMVAMCTSSGEVIILAVNKPQDPRIIVKYRLQSGPLDILKFSQCGQRMIATRKMSGMCFCLVSTSAALFSTVYPLETPHKIVDTVLYDEQGVLKVLILRLSSDRALVGHTAFIYEWLPSQEKFMEAANVMVLPSAYRCLHYAPTGQKILIATHLRTRCIHHLQITDDGKIILIHAVSTAHKIRHFNISTTRQYIITSGYDGIVTVFNNQQSSEASIILLSHHRKDLGVSTAICSPSGHLVIALGRNGSLVCLELQQKHEEYLQDDLERRKMILSDYSKLNSPMLSQPCQIFPPEGVDKTWLEWREAQILLRVDEKIREKQQVIKNTFSQVKSRLALILDDNERCVDNEKLPIAIFDLAINARQEKILAVKKEQEEMRKKLEFECSSLDKVSNWIKTTFWDPLTVFPQSLFPIFGDLEVKNYPTTAEDPQDEQIARWVHLLNDLTKNSSGISNFTVDKYAAIKRQYRPSRLEQPSMMDSLLISDEESEDEQKWDQQTSEGTTTHRFISSRSQYSQFEVYTLAQFILINRDIITDIQQLRDYFNQHFIKVIEAKNQEMILVQSLNGKIREINFELRQMFDQSIPEVLEDPQWHEEECPESIINVIDEEVTARRYISASQQELLKKEAAEAERMRLLLTVDDFREKALLTMMDGVLEVQWKDVIKKDIPMPDCMLVKKPKDYDLHDIEIVQKYEADVLARKQEREKYRRILEDQYTKIIKILKDSIAKFDRTHRNLAVERMKVESAIQQLKLLRFRQYLKALRQRLSLQEARKIAEKISNLHDAIDDVLKKNQELQDLLPRLKKHREGLRNRQKTAVKKFKREFLSLSKFDLDYLRKQSKKRPRLSLRSATAEDLLELGKCVVASSTSVYMSPQCLEFLAGVTAIDTEPATLPESVTPQHWAQLIRVRRRKIGLEMELRAHSLWISEIDRALSRNNTQIDTYKQSISNLSDDLIKIKFSQANSEVDLEIQLVLKMAQVEMDPSVRKGTENCVLLPKYQVEEINELVGAAGTQKLDAMREAISLHKKAVYREWMHRSLRQKIDHLTDDLGEIKRFTVTKDLREFLRRHSQGLPDDKTLLQLEKEITAMKITSKKLLRDSLIQLESIEAKIERKKRANAALDRSITRMNVRKWEMELQRDLNGENRCRNFHKRKLQLALQRSKLLRMIQDEHVECLHLQAELRAENQKKSQLFTVIELGTE